MRMHRVIAPFAFLVTSAAWSHESNLVCDAAAAKQPAIETARAELKQKPKSTSVRTTLADALVGVGCYEEAIHVLEDGVKLFPNDRGLRTRLDTARSFIGEREYLEKQRATNAVVSDAEFLRLQLRCKQIGDLGACDQALGNKPNDATLWVAKGDALLKDKRSRDALIAFNRAKQVSTSFPQQGEVDVSSRINAAQALLASQNPPAIAVPKPTSAAAPTSTATTSLRTASVTPPAPRFSNVEPASRSN